MKKVLQIYRDSSKPEISYLNEPLAEGEQGNMQTLAAMADLVRDQRTQPDLRNFVLREIIGGVRGHDSFGEVRAIFEYARDRITYRKDPFGVERVADIWSTLYGLNANGPEGDCGIKSGFVAACCALLGHKPAFVVIKQDARQRAFNHVYNVVVIDGQPHYFDATPEGKPAGWEASSEVKKIFPIFD